MNISTTTHGPLRRSTCVWIGTAVVLALVIGSTPIAAQDCDCIGFVPDKFTWSVRLNSGAGGLTVAGKLATQYLMECGAKQGGGKSGSCQATAHLTATGASFFAVTPGGERVPIFTGVHGIFADSSDTIAAGRCSRNGKERKSVAYYAFLDDPEFEYTHIVGNALLSLSATCDLATLTVATPSIEVDTSIRKNVDLAGSDLDGDGSPGAKEALDGTSDALWDFDYDGVPDGIDEAPADPNCSINC